MGFLQRLLGVVLAFEEAAPLVQHEGVVVEEPALRYWRVDAFFVVEIGVAQDPVGPVAPFHIFDQGSREAGGHFPEQIRGEGGGVQSLAFFSDEIIRRMQFAPGVRIAGAKAHYQVGVRVVRKSIFGLLIQIEQAGFGRG